MGRPDLGRVDVYGLTMKPPPPVGWTSEHSSSTRRWWRRSRSGHLRSATESRCRHPSGQMGARPRERSVTVVDRLSPAVLTPVELEEPGRPGPEVGPGRRGGTPLGPSGVAHERPAAASVVLGARVFPKRATESCLIASAGLLSGSPPSPPAPSLGYSEDVITVRWQPPGGTRRAAQVPATATGLPEQPIVNSAPAFTYNVYEVSRRPGPPLAMPVPLNASPLQASPYEDARVEFGVERCYVVRTVDTLDGFQVQSEASPLGCVTPIDTFPPARPAGLVAVGDERAISLIWAAGAEEDLGGYLILRGPSVR